MKSYIFHINFYDLGILGTIFTGLTLALLLWCGKGINRTANRFLALALGIVVLWMIRVLGVDVCLDTYFPGWGLLPLQYSLALGPLLYFWVLKLTRVNYAFRNADALHFLPLLFELGAYILETAESLKTGTPVYNTPVYERLNSLLLFLAFASVTVYLYLCYRLVESFYREQSFTGGDRYRRGLRWLQNSLAGFGLVWLSWIPFTALNFFYYKHRLDLQTCLPLFLLFAFVMIWIAARAFLRQGFAVPPVTMPALKPILPGELKRKGAWLKKAVTDNGYYRDPGLTLASLAAKLNMHTHELSRIINTVHKKGFNDFINGYRVLEASRRMNDPAYDHITLLGIAYGSGFNSQSTFNRIFRQLTGRSPLEYKNSLKKEHPSYNLGSHHRAEPVILHGEVPVKWAPEKSNRSNMLKNYFRIAWRNLVRSKSYAAINITGLAVGIAVCIMIFIIIQFQTGFDDFHAKKDRIYRVLTEYHHAGSGIVSYGKDVSFPLPLGLKTAFPQLEQVAPVFASHDDQLLITNDNGVTINTFKEQKGVFFAGPSFFNIFNFPLLAGSYASLKDPNNVLLTKEIAEKYFGDWKAAIGKTISLQSGGYIFEHGTDILKISGILATIPANTDFQLKLVVAYGTGFTGEYRAQSTNWDEKVPDFGCYILLPPGMSAGNFNRQLRAYSRKVESAADNDTHMIQPLNEVHYDTRAGNYSNKTISHQLLNVLWLIAAFILLIACVNFINLSTAQAVNRAKEVGVRKVLGSSKLRLQAQFIVETFLIVAIAITFAVIITVIAMPYVNRLLELSLSFNVISHPMIVLFLFAITAAVTALAGFYPSVVLSGFNPVTALKSKLMMNAANGISLRRGLVVFQFIIAQALIIGTLVIARQMNFFMDRPLGFDKDAVINVPFRVDSVRISRMAALKKQLLALNGVQTVSFSSNTPIENGNDMWSTVRFNHAAKESDFKVITKFADNQFMPAYKLRLAAGRNLRQADTVGDVLVNESLVKNLGFNHPEDVLNKNISTWNGVIHGKVVGVLKDFNNRSFHHSLAPLLVTTDIAMYSQVGIKLSTAGISSAIPAVKKIFGQTFPDFVFEYKFLDEKIADFYKQENQLAQLYKLFAAIAIFLSCLGLYGLASFMAVQRVKEVGIRKVLGAGVSQIVYLFSKEFIVLIAIAFTVAVPIAWYYMHQWLQGYAYRISISWGLIAAAGFSAVLIAFVTISFRAIKAAVANPVKSLRNE